MKYDTPLQMDGHDLLRQIPSESAALVIADPQYRGVLDMLGYGNEGASKQTERSALPQMSEDDIRVFVEQAERILRPSSHILLWCDKHTIGSGSHLRYFRFMSRFQIVDLIAWNKGRIGNGYRSRNSTEYLVIAQKEPIRAKGIWTNHGIPDSWTEKKTGGHPHAKPAKLTKRLIEATTRPGDLIVDPCAGSFMVLDICRETGRRFLGCDLRALPGGPEARRQLNGHQAAGGAETAPAGSCGPSAVSLLAKLRAGAGIRRGIPTMTEEVASE